MKVIFLLERGEDQQETQKGLCLQLSSNENKRSFFSPGNLYHTQGCMIHVSMSAYFEFV